MVDHAIDSGAIGCRVVECITCTTRPARHCPRARIDAVNIYMRLRPLCRSFLPPPASIRTSNPLPPRRQHPFASGNCLARQPSHPGLWASPTSSTTSGSSVRPSPAESTPPSPSTTTVDVRRVVSSSVDCYFIHSGLSSLSS